MQVLVRLLLKAMFGVQIPKDIIESYNCKSEHWMQTEYDDNVLDYGKIPKGYYIEKKRQGTR